MINSTTLKRTPKTTTESLSIKTGRGRNPTQSVIYQKEMYILLTGSDPRKLQTVAAAIHSLAHPYTDGGKEARQVTMIADSTEPVKVFDGMID